MCKFLKKIAPIALLCGLLCACTADLEPTDTATATSDTSPGQTTEQTVSIADRISQSQTVTIRYYEEEVYTSSDPDIIQTFAKTFAQWDPSENETECMDTLCAVEVLFDDVQIRCNVTGNRYGVVNLPEPSFYYLPKAFLDLVDVYVGECVEP